jgi:F0F1-type ATP synthase assembly protein I
MLVPRLRMILDQHFFFIIYILLGITLIFLIVIRSGTPRELRGSGSRFSFRLEERAEKRKEVVDALL